MGYILPEADCNTNYKMICNGNHGWFDFTGAA